MGHDGNQIRTVRRYNFTATGVATAKKIEWLRI
jgi:hypothetical protein